MVKVIVINKCGNLKSSNIKIFDIETLYKKCNLRKNDHFDKRTSWKFDNDHNVTLFSKDEGRANSENKYELPPPIDDKLYFGNMILVKHTSTVLKNDNAVNLTIEEWSKLYEKLFGGFEDLGEEDSYSDEEEIPAHMQTKEGYSKEDGFIVSDNEEEDEDYLPEKESEEEEEAHSSTDDAEEEDIMGKESDIEVEEEYEDEESDVDDYDSDIGSELSEESYIDSD
jgi:hypothetical protein